MLQCLGSKERIEATHEYEVEESENAGIPPKIKFTGKISVEMKPPMKIPMKMMSLLTSALSRRRTGSLRIT